MYNRKLLLKKCDSNPVIKSVDSIETLKEHYQELLNEEVKRAEIVKVFKEVLFKLFAKYRDKSFI